MDEIRAVQLANGKYQVEYGGTKYELSEAQLAQLSKAQTDEDIQAFFRGNGADENGGKSQIELLDEKSDEVAERYKQDEENIRNLPEEYAKRYQEIEDDTTIDDATRQAKQTEVIKEFLADPKYNELTPVGPETVGNRHSTKHEGGLEFSMARISEPLVGRDGQPNQEIVERKAEEVKAQFQADMDRQLAAIDADPKLNNIQKSQKKNDLVLEQALNTSFGPQVRQLAEANKHNPAIVNKQSYYELAMTQEQKSAVMDTRNKILKQMNELLTKPNEELTDDDRKQLLAWKNAYNNNFVKDKAIEENQNLENLKYSEDPKVLKDTYEKLKAVALLLGIEEQIKLEQKANGDNESSELNASQMKKLARAQMKVTITHEDERQKLSERLLVANNEKESKNLKDRIKYLDAQTEKMMKDIKEGVAIDRANAQVRQQMYEQKFKHTHVSWDEAGAEEAKKNHLATFTTHLNKYARNIIMKDADFRDAVCTKANGKADGDFQVDGQWYKLDSDKYKAKMQALSNKQRDFHDSTIDTDYYASTGEWVDFADSHAKKAEKRYGDGQVHADAPATMSERRHAREMFEIAGIETSSDLTYLQRGKDIAAGAIVGGVGGALSGIAGELLNYAKNIHYSGTAIGIAQGVVMAHVSGVASTHISGNATGVVEGDVNYHDRIHVEGETGFTAGYSGQATDNVSLPFSETITDTYTSNITQYDPKTGQYVIVGQQTTPVEYTVSGNASGNVTINYSGTVTGTTPYETWVDVDGTVHYRQEVSIPYDQDVNIPYEKDVEVPYKDDDVKTPYEGDVKKGFDWGNVGKAAGIGALIGAAVPAFMKIFKKKNASDYANADTAKDYNREDTGYVNTPKAPDTKPVKVVVEKQQTVIDHADPQPIENTDHKMVVKRCKPGETMNFRGQQVPFNRAENKKYYVQQLYNVPDDKIDAVYKYIMETINELKPGQYNDAQYVNGNTYHFPKSLPKELTGLDTDYEQQDMTNYVPRWIQIPITTGKYTGFTGGQKGLEKPGSDTTHTTKTNRTDVYDKHGRRVK